MRVVTVGTGMAAAEFVERLRLEGFEDEIVMLGDEDFPPYSPCVIPFFLAGEPLDTVFWKGRDFYDRYRVTALLGDAVVEVDPEGRMVRTAGGRTEQYDTLFFAPGARNRYPRPEWLETAGVFGFKTLSDMLDIGRYITEQGCAGAVVYGGGFIGVDAALALESLGLRVTIVHRNTRLLSQMTDEEGGQFATRRLAEKTGMDIRLRTTVEGITSDGGKLTGVRLADGTSLATQLLIVAVGVEPNSRMLAADDTGVRCTDQMLADPCVYTAGDVAVTRHAVDGTPGIHANAPSAVNQARTAARHLVHGDGAYPGSLNSTVLRKHIDFPIISVGRFSGDALTWQRGDVWRRVYLQDGRINGYIVIGDTRMSGYLYQLYLSRKQAENELRELLAEGRHDGYYRGMLGITSG
ncbi:NAD(P)/FAD-dependent oxidoreductase [bacterium]|nr:NAD(P)/FAD-dependent oxidoreductase [bacterium]